VRSNYALVRSQNVFDHRFEPNGLAFISDSQARDLAGAELKDDDVLLNITGDGVTFGRSCLVPSDALPACVNQHVMLIRVNPERCVAGYLASWLSLPDTKSYIESFNAGGSRRAITKGHIEAFKVPLPSIDVQRDIAAVSVSINRRIELLRQTNATLESIAQALFKSWFIDFDPVRAKAEGREPEGIDAATAALFPAEFEESALGLIPKGWRAGVLGDAFHINPARSLSKGFEAKYLEMANAPTSGHRPLQPVDVRAFGSGCKFQNGDALLAKITPCLENGKGAYVDFLDGDEVGWGSTEFIVLRSKPSIPAYASYLLTRHEPFRQFAIQAMTGTSGRQRVELSRLGQFQLAVPPSSAIAEATNATFAALQTRIAANSQQAATLAHLRDTLLPRLISGKLRLPEARAQVEEAIA
jgi:type I restriction enzyme S subunit